MSRLLILATIGCPLFWYLTPMCAADFVDVSPAAGIDDIGESYGASWGDFDGDGYADLWVGNHAGQPMLYLNHQDSTFTYIVPLVWPGRFLGSDSQCNTDTPGVCLADTHGSAWIDFDNDGDQDLLEVVGGARVNFFFENDGDELIERAVEYGLHSMGARSSSPVWLDWNRDGLIDAVLAHELNASEQPLSLTNLVNLLVDAGIETLIGEHSAVAAYLADITEDGTPELVLSSGNLNTGPDFFDHVPPFCQRG